MKYGYVKEDGTTVVTDSVKQGGIVAVYYLGSFLCPVVNAIRTYTVKPTPPRSSTTSNRNIGWLFIGGMARRQTWTNPDCGYWMRLVHFWSVSSVLRAERSMDGLRPLD